MENKEKQTSALVNLMEVVQAVKAIHVQDAQKNPSNSEKIRKLQDMGFGKWPSGTDRISGRGRHIRGQCKAYLKRRFGFQKTVRTMYVDFDSSKILRLCSRRQD